MAGRSASPTNPGLPPGGHPDHVRYLQAALDAERKHALLLTRWGARSPAQRFYFPRTTFHHLGTSLAPTSFLGVMERLETALMGMYLAAAGQALLLRQRELATLVATITGVEAEHRIAVADLPQRPDSGGRRAESLRLRSQHLALVSRTGPPSAFSAPPTSPSMQMPAARPEPRSPGRASARSRRRCRRSRR